jgi:cytochrome c
MREGLAIIFRLFLFSVFICCCRQPEKKEDFVHKEHPRTEEDYIKPIPGKSEPISAEQSEKGQVLIAYSDCYTCHAIDKRSKGPAFKDIAKRYPVNDGYINLLAQKIIVGGSGAWGYPVMAPHPDISVENATLMVKYILSLKE